MSHVKKAAHVNKIVATSVRGKGDLGLPVLCLIYDTTSKVEFTYL